MLSRLSLFLNIILILAVAYLYKMHFSDEENESVVTEEASKVEPLKIAYVNVDTLDANYQFILDKYKELELVQQKNESRISREMKNAEKRVRELQENARWMTEQQAIDAQNELAQLEQNISSLQARMSNELLEKQQQVNKEYRNNLMKYLDVLNDENDFDYIMAVSEIGGILHAKDTFDLTERVLGHLNDSYLSDKSDE